MPYCPICGRPTPYVPCSSCIKQGPVTDPFDTLKKMQDKLPSVNFQMPKPIKLNDDV